jgi:hypothetical protein
MNKNVQIHWLYIVIFSLTSSNGQNQTDQSGINKDQIRKEFKGVSQNKLSLIK